MINRWVFLLMMICGTGIYAQEIKPESDQDWWQTVKEVLHITSKSEEANIKLVVVLTKPERELLKLSKAANGEATSYTLRGERLPEGFYPGSTIISKFSLYWDGKQIAIPARFWRDLAGFRIQVSPLKPETLAPNKQWEALQFLAGLDQPRLILSADEKTVLIEWRRPEECDRHSTIRWIVSRSGTILRHRLTPPDGC